MEETIESNFVSSVGKKVDEFEKILATFTGARFAVVTMNGTAALHVSLHANGIDRNSEVITQAMTFVATANSIKYTGADVSFIDVDPKTFLIDPLFFNPLKIDDPINPHPIIET